MCFWTNENFLGCGHGRKVLTGTCLLLHDKSPEQCEIVNDMTYHWTEGKCPRCVEVEAEKLESIRKGFQDTHLSDAPQPAHMSSFTTRKQTHPLQSKAFQVHEDTGRNDLSIFRHPALIPELIRNEEMYALDDEEFESPEDEDENDENAEPHLTHADECRRKDEMINWRGDPFEPLEEEDDDRQDVDGTSADSANMAALTYQMDRMDIDDDTPKRRWNDILNVRHLKVAKEGRQWTHEDQNDAEIAFRLGEWARKDWQEDILDTAEHPDDLLNQVKE